MTTESDYNNLNCKHCTSKVTCTHVHVYVAHIGGIIFCWGQNLDLASVGKREARDQTTVAVIPATRLVGGASEPATAWGCRYINQAGTLTRECGISWPLHFELSGFNC